MVQIANTTSVTKTPCNVTTETESFGSITSDTEPNAHNQHEWQTATRNSGDINTEFCGKLPLESAIDTVNVQGVKILLDSGADPTRFASGILRPFERAHAMLVKLIGGGDFDAISDMLQIIDLIREATQTHQIGKRI
ncbi:MAG: hypothetical protein U0936_11120 [Planctomycetaceae bacterium]